MRRMLVCGCAVAVLLHGTPAAPDGAREDGEALLPGPARELAIAAGEVHVWRAAVGDTPLLVTVEQRGIDLVVAARPAAAAEGLTANAPNGRWGAELLLLPAAAGGGPVEHRIEVRPAPQPGSAGRYAISVEPLPAAAGPESPRVLAAEAMSRAGRLVAAGTSEALAGAAAAYREAQQGWRGLGERRLEAEAAHCLAEVERLRGDLRAAEAGYGAALALWRQLGDGHREALALNRLGRVGLDRGEFDAARRAFTGAIEILRRLGERFGEGEVRSNLCLVEQTSGALPAALACYEEAQAVFSELGDRGQQALLLNNIGGIHDLRGEPDAALAHYAQALALRRELGDRPGEAQTLNNVAAVHRALGEWQEALRIYGEVREILAALGNRLQEAVLLNNLGYTYLSLGEPQRALGYLEDALTLRRLTADRRGEVITLNNLGLAWRRLGDLDKALEHHRQALAAAAALGDARQQATTGVRLAEIHLDRGDPAAALGELDPALADLRAAGNRRGESTAVHLRGRALALAGRPLDALPLLEEALALRRALRDRAGEAETLTALAAAERALGRGEAAREHAAEAVARVEAMRTGLVSPDLRAAFLATRRRAYELLGDLLMDRHAAAPAAGHDREAFAVSERMRARTLLDALEGLDAGRAGGSAPAALRERRLALRRRLSATVNQELRQSGEAAAALGREIEALLAEIDGLEAEIRRRDPRYAAFSDPPAVSGREVDGLLEPGTLLLEYALGEERSFLWAVGGGAFRSFVLPPQREIEALARRFHEELRTVEAGGGGGEAGGGAAAELGRILLAPVWGEAARVRRLVVVPDAALHLVPFAALPVPEPGGSWDEAGARLPLLEHQEVVYLPSASTLAVARRRLAGRPAAPKRAAVLADPVFAATDPRVAGPAGAATPAGREGSSGGEAPAAARGEAERGVAPGAPLAGVERLPASGEEAAAIAGLAPAGEVWTAVGLAASRELALSSELGAYRVVHFATHGIADTADPERSGLVLSLVDGEGRPREGFLGLPDIYGLDWAADLVVLSGCQTALGKEVRGEGLMGLTRGFLYAGVPRVVASLWRVQDRTTAELMRRFYRALWQEGLSPAAALRQAQRSLRREPRYRDPYSWAAFVLQGEWRQVR